MIVSSILLKILKSVALFNNRSRQIVQNAYFISLIIEYIGHYQSEDFDIPLDDIITDKKI